MSKWVKGKIEDVKTWVKSEFAGDISISDEDVGRTLGERAAQQSDMDEAYATRLAYKTAEKQIGPGWDMTEHEYKRAYEARQESPDLSVWSGGQGKEKLGEWTTQRKAEGWKPTNPKDLVGVRKVPMSTLSCPVLLEVALGMQEGGCKYGRHNYRVTGVAASIYYDATMRHLMDWWEGEDIDPDSGLSHITKAISSLFVLRDAMINQKFTDDRPIKPINREWLKELNAKASEICDKYPNPKQPHTALPLPE